MGRGEYWVKLGALFASFALSVGMTVGCANFEEEPELEEAEGLAADAAYLAGLVRTAVAPGTLGADEAQAYKNSITLAAATGMSNGDLATVTAVYDAVQEARAVDATLSSPPTEEEIRELFYLAESAYFSVCGSDTACAGDLRSEVGQLIHTGSVIKSASHRQAFSPQPDTSAAGDGAGHTRHHKTDNPTPSPMTEQPAPAQLIEWVIIIVVVAVVVIIIAEIVWYVVERVLCPSLEEDLDATGVELGWECMQLMFPEEGEELGVQDVGAAAPFAPALKN